jgi:hypothetical protein
MLAVLIGSPEGCRGITCDDNTPSTSNAKAFTLIKSSLKLVMQVIFLFVCQKSCFGREKASLLVIPAWQK